MFLQNFLEQWQDGNGAFGDFSFRRSNVSAPNGTLHMQIFAVKILPTPTPQFR